MEKKLTKKEKELMVKELHNMIPVYGKQNDESKVLKKELDNLNGQIKNIMSTLELSDTEAGDYTAAYEVRETKSMNEDKLLELLTSNKNTYEKCVQLGIIKTREYIDDKALEDALYRQELGKKLILEMDKCEEVKKTPYLTVKKKKEKKGDKK